MKRRLRAVQERLNRDLLGVEAREGLRLAMGLGGGDGGIHAISLFAMPTMLDFAHSVRVLPRGRTGRAAPSSVRACNGGGACHATGLQCLCSQTLLDDYGLAGGV